MKNGTITKLLFALITIGTVSISNAWYIELKNELEQDSLISIHNRGCKDKMRIPVAAQSSTAPNNLNNEACAVTWIKATVKDVPLIPMFEEESSPSRQSSQAQSSRRRGSYESSYDGSEEPYRLSRPGPRTEYGEEVTTMGDQPETRGSQETSRQQQQKQLTKQEVEAIPYRGEGPFNLYTGSGTQTFVLRKKLTNGNPTLLPNKNKDGELINPNGIVIRDSKNSTITEKDGHFFNKAKKDITEELTSNVKRQILAVPVFEVIRLK